MPAMPVPTSRKSFQKEILKLMMEGIKVGLVSSLQGAVSLLMRRDEQGNLHLALLI